MSSHRRRYASTLIILVGFILVFSSLGTTPGSLYGLANFRCDGVENNKHVTDVQPTFTWDFPHLQADFQLEVDDDPNFTGTTLWFWDTGTGVLGPGSATHQKTAAQGNLHQAKMSDQTVYYGPLTTSSTIRPLDRRAEYIYARLRVMLDDGTWTDWTETQIIKMDQLPTSPTNLGLIETEEGILEATQPEPINHALDAAATGTTYYLDTAGADPTAASACSNGAGVADGAVGSPWLTFNKIAHCLVAGDTLKIKAGTYTQNFILGSGFNSAYQTPHSGTAISPITVTYNTVAPLIQAQSGCVTSSYNYPSRLPCAALYIRNSSNPAVTPVTNWVIDGIKFGGDPNTTDGVVFDRAKDMALKNATFDASLNQTKASNSSCSGTTFTSNVVSSVFITGGSQNIHITGCTFDQPTIDQLNVTASEAFIYGNTFTKPLTHSLGINGHADKRVIVSNNVFAYSSAKEGMMFVYLGSAGTRIYNNIFAHVTNASNRPTIVTDPGGCAAGQWGNGSTYGAIVNVRSGKVVIENNDFHDMTEVPITLNEETQFSQIRNNIFSLVPYAVLYRGQVSADSSTRGAILGYNLFWNMTDGTYKAAGYRLYSASEHDPNTVGGQIIGNVANGASAVAADGPQYVDPNNVALTSMDFHLNVTGPAVDAGDPATPVPEEDAGVAGDVGTRADIGAHEFGATGAGFAFNSWPYSYQAKQTIYDDTPNLSWAFNDPDNLLDAIDPFFLPVGDYDYQTKFRVLIDTTSRFNSYGSAVPLFDSTIVASTVQAYDIPSDLPNVLPLSYGLTRGTYYVMVSTWNDGSPYQGVWSDPRFKFAVNQDPNIATYVGAGRTIYYTEP